MSEEMEAISCALPHVGSTVIRLGHGSGGKMTANLIENVFLPRLGNVILNQLEDASIISLPDNAHSQIAVTTDSYVVSPIFFPGGDIGSLAIHGTINDLAMRGAMPLAITAGFILEEGLLISELTQIITSMQEACTRGQVNLVAADTKVVGRGAADRLFINTTGIGIVRFSVPPSVKRAMPGDVIIVNGDIGRHGMAVMATREGLELETTILSDSAPLHRIVESILPLEHAVHCLRDITRGGLAGVLTEIATASNMGVLIHESEIPIDPQVNAICELLGLDPLYVACEGRFVTVLESARADEFLQLMNERWFGEYSFRVIGKVVEEHRNRVVLRSRVGGNRIVDKLSGEQLPRIC